MYFLVLSCSLLNNAPPREDWHRGRVELPCGKGERRRMMKRCPTLHPIPWNFFIFLFYYLSVQTGRLSWLRGGKSSQVKLYAYTVYKVYKGRETFCQRSQSFFNHCGVQEQLWICVCQIVSVLCYIFTKLVCSVVIVARSILYFVHNLAFDSVSRYWDITVCFWSDVIPRRIKLAGQDF
jgi:hypothetical protein